MRATSSLQVDDARPQAPLRQRPFQDWSSPAGEVWTEFYRSGSGYLLRFPGIADFEVDANGGSIRCRPVPDVSQTTVEHLYLNQVVPLALSKQGYLVFHSSAVEIDGVAVAFMGRSGRGKSTLAGLLASEGHRVVADDGMQVEVDGEDFRALPSHPSLRLWDDSRQALFGADATVGPRAEYSSKTRLLAGGAFEFCRTALLLRNVYFLGEGTTEEASFLTMSSSEALVELVKHSFLLDREASRDIAVHFDQVSRLVGRASFYKLDYPRRFEAMGGVSQAILSHCHAFSGIEAKASPSP